MDNLTWIKGKHVLKAGGKIRYHRWLGTDSRQYVGSFSFNGQITENPAGTSGTGDSYADFLLGYRIRSPGHTLGRPLAATAPTGTGLCRMTGKSPTGSL